MKSEAQAHSKKGLGSSRGPQAGYVHGIEIRFHYQPNKFQTITNETLMVSQNTLR
ncbi:hypothetical protein CsSME_00038566 [Camellia sinensis var. sinensis]